MSHASMSKAGEAALPTRKLIRLAESAVEKGHGATAVELCNQILTTSPQHARAIELLAKIYESAGRFAVAEGFYQRLVDIEPTDPQRHADLANIYAMQNKAQLAIQAAHKAAMVAPDRPEGHTAFVSRLIQFKNAHAALTYLEQIKPMVEQHPQLGQYYALALRMNRRSEEAEAYYAKLIAQHRVPAAFRVIFETNVPRLPASADLIDPMREKLRLALEGFIKERPSLEINKLMVQPLFNIAFHNRDNRELVTLYRTMLRRLSPELTYTAAHIKNHLWDGERPVRVGFISGFMHEHPVGRCYRNMMLSLHADPRFEVKLFTHAEVADARMQQIRDAGLEVIRLPKHIVGAQKIIAERKFDILVYPDIGMVAPTYYLAMARLAPYQCVLTGHPETTGIDTMDYFISSRLYEPAHGASNYTETLLAVPRMDTLFGRPDFEMETVTRADMGLPEDKKLYVCPMSIQKMHPDFDDILATILTRDPNGVLVLFNDHQMKSASETLQQRILTKCPSERVIFLNWQPLARLMGLLKISDAVLATIYFGAGSTAQIATGFGIPMVNLPGEFARSRFVHGMYQLMGIEDPPVGFTTEEYVAAAVRIANDTAYREGVCRQLLERNRLLFEDNDYGAVAAQLMIDIMRQKLDSYALPAA